MSISFFLLLSLFTYSTNASCNSSVYLNRCSFKKIKPAPKSSTAASRHHPRLQLLDQLKAILLLNRRIFFSIHLAHIHNHGLYLNFTTTLLSFTITMQMYFSLLNSLSKLPSFISNPPVYLQPLLANLLHIFLIICCLLFSSP